MKPIIINLEKTFYFIGISCLLIACNGNSRSSQDEQMEKQLQTIKQLKASQDSMKQSYDKLSHQLEQKAKEPARVTVVRQAPISVSPSEATRVVINGVGVRMRLGPGKEYGYLQYYNGKAYTVAKGASLPFLGVYGNWYKVIFEGGEYFVSADFAYLR